jgi:hypothetical protein
MINSIFFSVILSVCTPTFFNSNPQAHALPLLKVFSKSAANPFFALALTFLPAAWEGAWQAFLL